MIRKKKAVGLITVFLLAAALPAAAQYGIQRSGSGSTRAAPVSIEEYIQALVENTYRRVVGQVVRDTVSQLRMQIIPPVYQQVERQVYAQGVRHPVIRDAFQRAHSRAYQVAIEQREMGTAAEDIEELMSLQIDRAMLTTRVRQATQQVTVEILKRVSGP